MTAHHQQNYFGSILMGAALFGALLLFFSGCSVTEPRGASSPRELLDTYLQALGKNDAARILRLIPMTHDADAAVALKLHDFGGRAHVGVHVSYLPQVNPDFLSVKISGALQQDSKTGVRSDFEDLVYLERIDNRWYLILGRHRDAVPEPPIHKPPRLR